MTDLHSLSGLRSLEIIDFEKYEHIPIHIVGLGAVGSKAFEQLVCLGARHLVLHDFDTVEHHNTHNQLFGVGHVGMTKVDACLDWVKYKYGDQYVGKIETFNHKVTEDTELVGAVLMCVDTFDGRRAVIQASIASQGVGIVVEGRCAPKFFEVRTINPFDTEQVEGFLGSLGDDSTPDTHVSICGAPISFSPVMSACGIIMVGQLISALKNGGVAPSQEHLNIFMQPLLMVGGQSLTGEV